MDEIDQEDHDGFFDYLFDDIGEQYVAEHAEEIALDFQTSGLRDAIVDAHRAIDDIAQGELSRANDRLSDGEWAEAIFHAARALDGYATDVFIAPFRASILKPFRAAFRHVRISDDGILGTTSGLESGAKFLGVGIAATRSQAECSALIVKFKALTKGEPNGGRWTVRNRTLHSLAAPSETDARNFVTEIGALLNDLSAPIRAIAKELDEASENIQKQIEESERWRN